MRVESIKIVFRDVKNTEETRGGNILPKDIVASFENGEWTIDGPLYSRILLALHEVWQRLRQEVKNG